MNGKSFKYKTKKKEKHQHEGFTNRPAVITLHVKITILLRHLYNCWRFLDLLLINCETGFDLSWTKSCVLIEYHNNITGINFMITSTKLYVPVVTLYINDNIKFLGNIKQGFKRTILWNKYRSEKKNNNKKRNKNKKIIT